MATTKRRGRPPKPAAEPKKFFSGTQTSEAVAALTAHLKQELPDYGDGEIGRLVVAAGAHKAMAALQREAPKKIPGRGNRPKIHDTVLLADVARVIASHNGTTKEAELNKISGSRLEKRKLQTNDSDRKATLCEVEKAARVILSESGLPIYRDLRQQARRAKAF